MGRDGTRPRGGVLFVCTVIAATVLLQTAAHLKLALGERELDTVFDLDRSNGLPDIVSTVALAAGTAGAVALGMSDRRLRRLTACLASALAILTLADVLHDGAHPMTATGPIVIGLGCFAGVLLFLVGLRATRASRIVLAVAGIALVGAFAVPALDRYESWFERERGDPVREYQIVAKEGLELLGWSLVAVALWGEAARRRRSSMPVATARASRAQAPPTRHAA